jgi:hypothetical protein
VAGWGARIRTWEWRNRLICAIAERSRKFGSVPLKRLAFGVRTSERCHPLLAYSNKDRASKPARPRSASARIAWRAGTPHPAGIALNADAMDPLVFQKARAAAQRAPSVRAIARLAHGEKPDSPTMRQVRAGVW